MQQQVIPPKEPQGQESPPSQDRSEEILTALKNLTDMLKVFVQQALTPNRVTKTHLEATQETQNSFVTTGASSKAKRLKSLHPPIRKKTFKGFNVQCWKCKGKHYPKSCPQLQHKCYFCGSPDHKIPQCPKKNSAICYVCKQPGHFANRCPEGLKLSNKASYQPRKDHPFKEDNEERKRLEAPLSTPCNPRGQWLLTTNNNEAKSRQDQPIEEMHLHHEEPLETNKEVKTFEEH